MRSRTRTSTSGQAAEDEAKVRTVLEADEGNNFPLPKYISLIS